MLSGTLMHIGQDIQQAAQHLRNGGLVAIPTETVYGLAANAFDPDAVIRIFEAKKRPLFNPLIVHAASMEQLTAFAGPVPAPLKQLCDHFWPGPLTVLLPRKEAIHPIVTAGSPLVAVRIPAHPLTLNLLSAIPFPLAAPSANLFGTVSPTTAQHVADQFGDTLDYILDGGPCKVGIESTIVKMGDDEKVWVLRPGGVPMEALADVLGYVPMRVRSATETPEAPGMLRSHYAPGIPLMLGNIAELLPQYAEKKLALLSLNGSYSGSNIIEQVQLSASGDLHMAARHLFGALRDLENSGADIILAEPVPDTGIGIAINDRLQRASA